MSRLNSVIGLCKEDVPGIANMVNTAQQRLLYCVEAGEEGWWGTWAEIAFNVSRSQPYITLPREIARIEAINVLNRPVTINNQFYEYLNFGNGRMPKTREWCHAARVTEGFTRNNAVLFTELTNTPQYITVYYTDVQDIGKRVMVEGLNVDGEPVTSQDEQGNVLQGEFLTLQSPSAQNSTPLVQVTGIQKDVTVGIVRIYQHDPTTGDEVLILSMQPGEMTASYRRYYFEDLPRSSCASSSETEIQITALAKLDPIPVHVDTDYLLIQNLEAIIEECASVRYSEQDNPISKQMAQERHIQAVRMLNGELNHFIGKESVAVGFAPFGSARLSHQKVGSLI
jgi:hypothetical protein